MTPRSRSTGGVRASGAPVSGPPKITPRTLSDYFEVLTKAVFIAGFSWDAVESKWSGFRQGFNGFDPRRVVDFTNADVERLTQDSRIIRNRRKIEATVDNARRMLALEEAHGSFRDYLRSLGEFDQTVRDLKKQFRFLGEFGAYYFLWTVNEPVPPYEDWSASRGRAPIVPRRRRG